MTLPDDDRTARLVSRALHEQAAEVEPSAGALAQIRRRTATGSSPGQESPRPSWLPAALGAGLATAAVMTAVVLVGDHDGGAAAPAVSPPPVRSLTVYYGGPRLFSETHAVTSTSPSDAVAAVHELLTSVPLDPDYSSGWPAGVDVEDVSADGGTAVIALAGDADLTSPGDLTPGQARTAIQALLATADVPAASFTDNGRPLTTLLGVDVSAPVARLPESDVRAFVSIEGLTEGQTVSSPVTVTVSGNTFEGTVNWRLLDASGARLDEGFVTTAMGEWRQADIRLGDLVPGSYTVEALEYSPADGEVASIDTKDFTVS